MFYGCRLKYGHLNSHSDPIICTQSRTFGFQPITFNICLYGIIIKIKINISILFTYHIHMTLQDQMLPNPRNQDWQVS